MVRPNPCNRVDPDASPCGLKGQGGFQHRAHCLPGARWRHGWDGTGLGSAPQGVGLPAHRHVQWVLPGPRPSCCVHAPQGPPKLACVLHSCYQATGDSEAVSQPFMVQCAGHLPLLCDTGSHQDLGDPCSSSCSLPEVPSHLYRAC